MGAVIHLPTSPLPMQRASLSLSRDQDVLFGCYVHCPWVGCQWSAAAWDASDALMRLEGHYATHDAERAALARRVDAGGVPA